MTQARPLALACLLALSVGYAGAAQAQVIYKTYQPIENVPRMVGVSFSQGDLDGSNRPGFVLSGRVPGGSISTRLYEPQGEETIFNTPPQQNQCRLVFAVSRVPLPQVWIGDVKLADVSGNGRNDLLIVGAQATEPPYDPVGVLYVLNSGALVPGPALPAVYNATLATDGSLIAVSGNTGSSTILEVLRFVPGTTPRTARFDSEAQLPGLELAALALATETDGTVVLVASGLGASGVPTTRHYRRSPGESAFRALPTTNVPALFGASAFLRDLNGDGILDLLIAGSTYGPQFVEGTTTLLLGGADGTFQPSGLDLPQLAQPVIDVMDHNGDGHLDLLLTGLLGSPLGGAGAYYAYDGDGAGGFSLYAQGPAPYGGDGGWFEGNRRGDLEIILAGTFGGRPAFEAYSGQRNPPPNPQVGPIGCPDN